MNAKKNSQRHETSGPMMEEMEGRTLYAVSLTPSIPIPPPRPTASHLVVVEDKAPTPTLSPVVISIIAVLIGM